MKKTILYVIDSLAGIGGAEIMMVAPLPEIHKEYTVILVTLYPSSVFDNYFLGDKQECLHMSSRLHILHAAKKLKKIIKKYQVDLVHSCLYWSVIVSRLACGNNVPHVFSLATMMSEHIYKYKWYSGYTRVIDEITYRKNQVIIAPSKEVLADFDKFIGIKGRAEMLHNFVADDFFENPKIDNSINGTFKLVAVGNLKDVKNYQLLIDGFKILQPLSVTLDIYGDGDLKDHLQRQIQENNLPINLKGSCKKIYEVLPQYNAFVMSSFHEGFGISVAEAMATGLPLLLSDIKVFGEVSQNNAVFFSPYSAKTFADAVLQFMDGKKDLLLLSMEAKKIAKENYTKGKYITSLLKLYSEVLR